MVKNIHPFNNHIETGLRVLTILNAAFPTAFDVQTLVYYDYLTVHSGDISQEFKSLHPSVPSRKGEILVRRTLIQESLEMFISKGLIIRLYGQDGITFVASENATPFIEALSEEYLVELNSRANWVVTHFLKYNPSELQSYMQKYIMTENFNFDLNLISNG